VNLTEPTLRANPAAGGGDRMDCDYAAHCGAAAPAYSGKTKGARPENPCVGGLIPLLSGDRRHPRDGYQVVVLIEGTAPSVSGSSGARAGTSGSGATLSPQQVVAKDSNPPRANLRIVTNEGRLSGRFEPFDCGRELAAKARHRARWRQAASYPSRTVSQNCTLFSRASADFRIPAPLGPDSPYSRLGG
jgi:hypothetical protein